MQALRYLAIAATTAALTGCAVLQHLQFAEPSLTLESISLTELGLRGGSVDLMVDVHNPNSFDLNTMRIEVGLDLEDTHFGDVELEERILIPSGGNAMVRIPLSFTWAGIGAGARGVLTRGSVHYGLDTRLYLDTPVGERAVGFETNGQVPLTRLLR